MANTKMITLPTWCFRRGPWRRTLTSWWLTLLGARNRHWACFVLFHITPATRTWCTAFDYAVEFSFVMCCEGCYIYSNNGPKCPCLWYLNGSSFGIIFSVKSKYYPSLKHVGLLPMASMPLDEELATIMFLFLSNVSLLCTCMYWAHIYGCTCTCRCMLLHTLFCDTELFGLELTD